MGKLTSFKSSGARVSTARDFTSVFLFFSSGYWYFSSFYFICINACYFLASFSYNYIATNSSFRL